MLAQSKKMALVVAVALLATIINYSQGQQPQTPSRKYQPVPPSVHIPGQETNRLQNGAFRSNNGIPTRSGKPTNGQVGFNFSDQGVHDMNRSRKSSARPRSNDDRPGYELGAIQQATYIQDGKPATNQKPASTQVPEILLRTDFGSRRQSTAQSASVPPQNSPLQDAAKLPNTGMPGQFKQAPIVSNDFPSRNELSQIHDQLGSRSPANRQPIQLRSNSTNQQQATAQPLRSAKTTNQPTQSPDHPQTRDTLRVPEKDSLTLKANPVTATGNVKQVEFQDFEDGGIPAKQISTEIMTTEETTSPLPNRASSKLESSAITLSAPSIAVQAFGPKSIGINKPATYKVKVENTGRVDAERILVGINLPEWVDIQKTNMTNGTKELSDGSEKSRLVWTVDHIPANSSQTITIEAIPREAKMFDMGVEWTIAPRSGVTAVEVTEPKLEMSIAGPRDVMYGETEMYDVTVRNPGTGTAENVIVMLPAALGGARAPLGNIEPGKGMNLQVELLARTAGELDLVTTAIADGELETSAKRMIAVRRAKLDLTIEGPAKKYSGGIGQYVVTIKNSGDATAAQVTAAMSLPQGIKYLAGVDSVKQTDGGLSWPIGSLDPGDQRSYKISCQLNSSGDIQIEAGARGLGELVAANQVITNVETVADLVLSVDDPRGPIQTDEDTTYVIRIKNRGTRSAKDVNVVMQFAEGIEPNSAEGLKHQIVPGQVLFSPITQIDPDQELTFKIIAKATMPGTHRFRAQLTCIESDSREIAEGTTRFFGDTIQSTAKSAEVKTAETAGDANSFQPGKLNR